MTGIAFECIDSTTALAESAEERRAKFWPLQD
jgi:hypothetical protein